MKLITLIGCFLYSIIIYGVLSTVMLQFDGKFALPTQVSQNNVPAPLVLDLDGDGLELSLLDSSIVNFDLDANKFAVRTAWVNADDGLLAFDRNLNGKIDNGTELFGNVTPINLNTSTATNGFSALVDFDSTGDGIIDANDTLFAHLLVWKDLNQNGRSEAGELSSLFDQNISHIDLNATVSALNVNGNAVPLESTFTRIDGSTGLLGNVIFKTNIQNTQFVGEYKLSLQALLLPTIRGYGRVADLHIAMSLDLDLLKMVKRFVDNGFEQSTIEMIPDTEAIIFKWAGVDTIAPDSMGLLNNRGQNLLKSMRR
jgi:hypothetical protein